MNIKELDRFMDKVEVTSGCWLWKAGLTSSGYGGFGLRGKVHMAHRVAYEHWKAPIPPQMEVDHLCYTRNCVNPEHLRVCTRAENCATARQVLKTHCSRGHSLDTFYASKRPGGKGYSRRCKVCHRASTKKWYLRASESTVKRRYNKS
jgi:hypothetical protein